MHLRWQAMLSEVSLHQNGWIFESFPISLCPLPLMFEKSYCGFLLMPLEPLKVAGKTHFFWEACEIAKSGISSLIFQPAAKHSAILKSGWIWHRGQFDTADNLTPQTIWHHGQFDTIVFFVHIRRCSKLSSRTSRNANKYQMTTLWHVIKKSKNKTRV